MYGDVRVGIEPDGARLRLAELRARGRVTSGTVSAVRLGRRPTRRISSMPAVMFPHWSLPPICSVTPSRRRSSRKSYAWSSMYENSVYEIPASSRDFTDSFCSM